MNSCGWERRLDIGPVVMDPEHLPVSILCVLTESRAFAGSHAVLQEWHMCGCAVVPVEGCALVCLCVPVHMDALTGVWKCRIRECEWWGLLSGVMDVWMSRHARGLQGWGSGKYVLLCVQSP